MEELISKQKALDLQMEAIQNEIEEYTEKRNRLYDKRLEINLEQNENICEINALKSVIYVLIFLLIGLSILYQVS